MMAKKLAWSCNRSHSVISSQYEASDECFSHMLFMSILTVSDA